MARRGTELRTDFTGDDTDFNKVLDRQKSKAKQFGSEWEKTNKKLDSTGKSAKGSAQGVLELSRAFEDAQYGMRGVLNNIPGLVMGFGGGALAAGAVSIAAVSADMAFRHFGKSAKGAGDDAGSMGDSVDRAGDLMLAKLDSLSRAWDKYADSISTVKELELDRLKALNEIASIRDGGDPFASEQRERQEALKSLHDRADAIELQRQKVVELQQAEQELIDKGKEIGKRQVEVQSSIARNPEIKQFKKDADQLENQMQDIMASLKVAREKRGEAEEQYESDARKLAADRNREEIAQSVRIAKTEDAMRQKEKDDKEEMDKEAEKAEKKRSADRKKAAKEREREAVKFENMVFADNIGGGFHTGLRGGRNLGPAGINTGAGTARPSEFRGLDGLEKLQRESVKLNQKIESHLNRVVKEL